MHPWKGLKGLPSSLWILAISTLVNRMGTMVGFFLALYLVQSRGWSEAEAATALAIYGAGSMVAGPFSGPLADRLGHRRTLAWSLGLSGLLAMALPYVTPQPLFLAALGLWSALNQVYWPASMALVADLAPEGTRPQAFVLHRLASNLGLAVGPALGGFLAQQDYLWLFLVDGFTTLGGTPILVLGVTAAKPTGIARSASRPAWRDRRLTVLLVAMVPSIMVFTQIHGALPLYLAQDLGYGPERFGLVFTFNTFLILLFEVAVNRHSTRWRHGLQLGVGAALVGLGFGLTGLSGTLPWLAATILLWTFGEMILLPASSETIAVLAPPERRGEYMGLYSFAWTVALTLGPWLGVKMRPHLAASVFWGVAGLVALGSAGAMAAWCRARIDGVPPTS